MNKSLLLISADDFPSNLISYFENQSFNCEFARGRLKIKEIFEKKKIDVAIWFFKGYDLSLAEDLITVFNSHDCVPVIMITLSYDDVEISKKVKNLFMVHDANDEIEDIHKSIFKACHESSFSSCETTEKNELFIPEINFKNVVREIVTDDGENGEKESASAERSRIDLETPWIAVDPAEKKILSEEYQPTKKRFLKKVLNWLEGN